MEDLVKKVSLAAGITEEQSRKAIACVGDYVKERLPGMFQSQIDPILNGRSWDESLREQASGLGEEIRTKTEGLATDLKEALDKAFKKKT
jgi:hypothetical protein